jgi:medium-chain acyl-[acyl-carrier-protein] hydrolase
MGVTAGMIRRRMPPSPSLSPWIVRVPRSEARLRLFCFPFSGAGALPFRGWSDSLPGVEACAFVPPGRETRLKESPITRMDPLVAELVREVLAHPGLPFAFYGHSLGAFVALEVARQLRRRGAPMPERLFVASATAPQLHHVAAPIAGGPDAVLIARLRRYGGTPEAVLAEPELMALLLPAFRADYGIWEAYRSADEPPLDVPISAFGGLSDDMTPREEIEGWRAQTTRAFALRMLPGGHLFLNTARPALLAALREDLDHSSGNGDSPGGNR